MSHVDARASTHTQLPFEAYVSRIPERIKPYIPEMEVVDNGVTTFVASPFASWVTNPDLKDLYIEHNPNLFPDYDSADPNSPIPYGTNDTINQFDKRMDNLGVVRRACSPPLSETRPIEDIIDENVTIGALITRRIMQEKGWETIKFLHVGSALLPTGMAKAILERAGINPEGVKLFEARAACASGEIGFIKATTDPELRDQDGIILTLEPLGSTIRHPKQYQDQLAVPALFGDMHVGMGINTRNFKPLAWRIRIKPGGGIKVKKQYEVHPTQAHAPSYLHLEFEEGATDMTQADAGQLLLDLEDPGEIGATMNGEEVGEFFPTNHSRLELDVLDDYTHVDPQGDLDDQTVHEPSRAVGTFMYRERVRAAKTYSELVQALVKKFKLVFMLPQMKDSNSSSSTVMKKWMYKVAMKLHIPRPGGKHFVSAPGIGSALVALVYEYVL